MEKKKAEGVNLKLYYESHKNDELIEQLKNKIKNLVEQIKSNVNTFDSKSFNHESVSQSININEVNYEEENDKI